MRFVCLSLTETTAHGVHLKKNFNFTWVSLESMETYYNALYHLGINGIIIFLLFLPIFIYGWIRFWQYRNHILIQKRFPLLCTMISVLGFVSGLYQGALFWIHYFTQNHRATPEFSAGFGYIVYGLVNIRLTLVYIRWKQNKSLLAHLNQTLPSHTEMSMSTSESAISVSGGSFTIFKSESYKKSSIYFSCPCISLLLLTIIGAGWIMFGPSWTRTYGMITGPLWMIQIFIMYFWMLQQL